MIQTHVREKEGNYIMRWLIFKTLIDLREYATLALRNVMEDNLENQSLIAELQPQEIVQTEELKEMGLSTELMQDGKVRIKKI